jgi:hypothetical protein
VPWPPFFTTLLNRVVLRQKTSAAPQPVHQTDHRAGHPDINRTKTEFKNGSGARTRTVNLAAKTFA